MPRTGNAAGAAATQPSQQHQQRLHRMEAAVREILKGLGEDVEREGLLDTPKRVAKALTDVTAGYAVDPASAIGSALFHEPIVADGGSGIVLVRDIDFASTSEHTLLPFHGRCHIAYLPAGGVVLGLSKLARVTKLFAKRLQSQQQLGSDIAAALCKTLGCSDVAVVLQARHLSSPGPDLPREHTTASLNGRFASPSSENLLELQELLGLSDLVACSPSSRLSSPTSVLSMGLSSDSESGSIAAPRTPDASEKDTDGDSDDVAMAAEADPLEAMEAAAQQLLSEVSPNPSRPELQGTARRYITSLLASTSGYHMKLPAHHPAPQQQQQQQQQQQPQQHDLQEQDDAARCCCSMEGLDSEREQQSAGASCCSLGASSASASTTVVTHGGQTRAVHHATVHFRSLCEHHMLPFYGKVHVAYTHAQQPGPNSNTSNTSNTSNSMPSAAPWDASAGSPGASGAMPAPVLPLSQLEHVVALYTQRLQVQERITHQVADAVVQLLKQRSAAPEPAAEGSGATGTGVVVLVDAAHMCMVARGVESHSGSTTSLAVRGEALQAAPELRCALLQEARRAAMRQ